MSLLLLHKADKERIVRMLFTVTEALTFRGVPYSNKVKVAQHFTALETTSESLDVYCRFEVQGNKTKLLIEVTEGKRND